jgi:hypothetical protein
MIHLAPSARALERGRRRRSRLQAAMAISSNPLSSTKDSPQNPSFPGLLRAQAETMSAFFRCFQRSGCHAVADGKNCLQCGLRCLHDLVVTAQAIMGGGPFKTV